MSIFHATAQNISRRNTFVRGDNTMLLAEAVGIGTADLKRIEVAGLSIKEAMFDFGPGPIGETI